MHAGPAAPPKNQLFLTTLPNGRKGSGGGLRLSVLLTPSLGDSNHLPAPFDKWPDYAGKLKWIASFFRPDHSVISPAISAGITPTIDPLSSPAVNTKLWQEIFVSVDKVARRKATNHVHKSS